jgi:hypothetical protein
VVEFLASDPRNLLLVATSKRVYAISPTNAARFAQTFARTIEMGSLLPAEPKSVYPSFIFSRAWENALVRFLWLAGLFLNIGLAVWVILTIPKLSQISLGFAPSGGTLPPSPASQLILLPIESAFLYLVGLFGGMYFFRWETHRVLAVIIWASSAVTSLFFLLAVLFIISTPV